MKMSPLGRIDRSDDGENHRGPGRRIELERAAMKNQSVFRSLMLAVVGAACTFASAQQMRDGTVVYLNGTTYKFETLSTQGDAALIKKATGETVKVLVTTIDFEKTIGTQDEAKADTRVGSPHFINGRFETSSGEKLKFKWLRVDGDTVTTELTTGQVATFRKHRITGLVGTAVLPKDVYSKGRVKLWSGRTIVFNQLRLQGNQVYADLADGSRVTFDASEMDLSRLEEGYESAQVERHPRILISNSDLGANIESDFHIRITSTPLPETAPTTADRYNSPPNSTRPSAVDSSARMQPLAIPFETYLFGGDGHEEFLGCFSCGEFDASSVWNKFSQFGFSNNFGIWNPFGQFANPFSMYSMCGAFASDPPVIVDKNGNFLGRASVNKFAPGSVCGLTGNEMTCLRIRLVCAEKN